MIRKLLVVAAAAAIPMGALAVGAVGSGVAGAAANTPITCAFTGTVSFGAPGLSHFGSATPNKTSTTNTSGSTFSGPQCGLNGSNPGNLTAQFPAHMIVSKNTTKCSKTIPNNPIPGCVKGDYVTDQASALTSGSTGASLKKALKKGTLALPGGVSAPFKTSVAGTYGGCGGGEQGFQISGTVKNKSYSYTTFALTICLGADTGSGTSGDFATDVVTALASPSGPTIATATIDPTYSSLVVS